MIKSLALLLCVACASASDPVTTSAPLTTMDSDTGRYHIEVRTTPQQPPVHGVVQVELSIRDTKTGTPLDGATISVVPWMPSHAHGTSVTPTVTALGHGAYRADDVSLYMPGSWQLRTTITAEVTDHATCTLDVR